MVLSMSPPLWRVGNLLMRLPSAFFPFSLVGQPVVHGGDSFHVRLNPGIPDFSAYCPGLLRLVPPILRTRRPGLPSGTIARLGWVGGHGLLRLPFALRSIVSGLLPPG